MKMIALQMTRNEMVAGVKRIFQRLDMKYFSLFHRQAGPDGFAFVCKSVGCGWWTDSRNNLLVKEIIVPAKDAHGELIPGQMATCVAICCPECERKVEATAVHLWRKTATSEQLSKRSTHGVIVPC